MNEEMVQQMMTAAARLAAATETLDRVLGKLDAQQEVLNAKVERIVAAVEESITQTGDRRDTTERRPTCNSVSYNWRSRTQT